MKSAIILPLSVPKTGMNGENAKDSKAGVRVLLIKLASPNKHPRTAPFLGPSKTEPTITGI